MSSTAAELVASFADRPDISARSTLVTVFGDTIAPAGGEIWLTDLFALMEPFRFSERLLRTSMTRLVSADWCTATREGRRSRYALTQEAAAETAEADERIYGMSSPSWDGEWTLVLVDGDADPSLRWNGFARLGAGVWGLPHDDDGRHLRVVKRLGLAARYPVATARFADIERLLDGGRLTTGFDLADLIEGYESFVARYDGLDTTGLDPATAFGVRTMIVHDLRRLRLRDPDLPAELLPDPWPGRDAVALASELYRACSPPTWSWVAATTDIDPDHLDDRIARRFPGQT